MFNFLANVLGGGNDRLNGGPGHDVLTGGNGADRFVIASQVYALHGDTTAEVALGGLPNSRFVLGISARDANDCPVYDQLSGDLFFDRDGNGGAEQVLLANLDAGKTLTSDDFLIIP